MWWCGESYVIRWDIYKCTDLERLISTATHLQKGQNDTLKLPVFRNSESSASHVHENHNAGGGDKTRQPVLLYLVKKFSFLLKSWIRCRRIVFRRSCRTHLHLTHVDSQWCLQPCVQPLSLTSYGGASFPLIIFTFSLELSLPTPSIPLLTNTSSILFAIHFS